MMNWTEKVKDIELIKNEIPLEDVLKNHRWHVQVSEHGFVDLIDVMPRLIPQGQTADYVICQAARVSSGAGMKGPKEDRALIRYLMRHRHTSPFEQAELKFHCCMPIFVARQWIRHRMVSVNEKSARYSVLSKNFFFPAKNDIRTQGKMNKQGRDELVDEVTADEFLEYLDLTCIKLYEDYEYFLEKGITRELARMVLPLNIFTEWYWKIDLHNLMHFLSLRLDEHAQKEIRDYAKAIFSMVEIVFPLTIESFSDYRLNSVTLSRMELKCLKENLIKIDDKLEQKEWEIKKKKFGL